MISRSKIQRPQVVVSIIFINGKDRAPSPPLVPGSRRPRARGDRAISVPARGMSEVIPGLRVAAPLGDLSVDASRAVRPTARRACGKRSSRWPTTTRPPPRSPPRPTPRPSSRQWAADLTLEFWKETRAVSAAAAAAPASAPLHRRRGERPAGERLRRDVSAYDVLPAGLRDSSRTAAS